ncbi:GNAT family N-acetyltransferase [Microbulbifer variabilis]|uniref:GNAT family N-acetyltransferase n=1 Tax=Microbulbifer variabilis TaxID=266805 RepID=UPI001CFC8413|nr:GNAT family N-acetyltransferase [Microbulbifer variabilis]
MIDYRINSPISTEEFIDLLKRSTLAERRPIHDLDCMDAMVKNANLLVGAWAGNLLVGVARSLTDFHFACYLSDLAVDESYQGKGIGKSLIRYTQEALGPHCWLTLLSAPQAQDYYPKIGFENNSQCWELGPEMTLR